MVLADASADYEGAAEKLAKIYLKINYAIRPKNKAANDLGKLEQSLGSFYSGFQVFREHPRQLIRPYVFHTIAYVLGLMVYVLIFYALGIPAASPGFYVIVYFIATAFQDATASLSVGSLEILLVTIFII
jgi:hypothetical protein